MNNYLIIGEHQQDYGTLCTYFPNDDSTSEYVSVKIITPPKVYPDGTKKTLVQSLEGKNEQALVLSYHLGHIISPSCILADLKEHPLP